MGELIRALRKERRLTLDGLAQASGSSKSYIWELENKAPPRPSAEKLSQIAAALGTTVDVLIGTPINTQDDLAPEDKVFFRKYVGLPDKDKVRLRKMLDLWDDE
ncbi:helix-turn-helix domain-containing protein [Paracoccus sp. Z118]|uniref:helix-turn-helix domain-containing protein n=1 Tax=Paracoccus sp. Z118 TaxID=2851017 RepID=UPI0020B8DE08|nr:helix-turn-helix transcriptional regulator [Paracoccus sp. Z118]